MSSRTEINISPSFQPPAVQVQNLRKAEFRRYSQFGEDGILLYLISQVHSTSRRFVEIGIEDGRQCNTANLSINFGWRGLLVDCNERDVELAKAYYTARPEVEPGQVDIRCQLITPHNVNQTLADAGMTGDDVDVFSLDIDGNDFWVWQALTVIRPRIVIVEYNQTLGPERSFVAKYDRTFNRFEKHPFGLYYGASLAAMTKLGREKGYELVGCESNGVNAFFVEASLVPGRFNALTPAQAYYPYFDPRIGAYTHERVDEVLCMDFHRP
jgi:hypothetical protein